MKTAHRADRLYTWLLRLYPTTFYDQFARDMSADFRDGHAAARRDGLRTRLSFTARSYGDLVVSLLSQRVDTERFVIWRMSVLVALAIWAVAVGVASFEWSNGPARPWFLMQLGVAVTAGATLTIAIALRIHNPEIPGRRALFADRAAIESSDVLGRPPVDPVIG
jgi:hypothetical protein